MVEFCDAQNQFKVPFIMYADFESILEPIQGPNPDPKESYASDANKHSPSGWCVYGKFAYGEVKDPLKLYRGKDCLEKFCDYIRQEAYRLYHMFPEKHQLDKFNSFPAIAFELYSSMARALDL